MNMNVKIGIIVVALVAAGAAIYLFSPKGGENVENKMAGNTPTTTESSGGAAAPSTGGAAGGAFQPQTFQAVTALKSEDLKVGSGPEAAAGKRVSVHYTGWLPNGQKFDSSKDRGTPFPFTLGSGQVIKGWDEGVQGMKVGGIRRLTIPSQMAYGERGYPPVIPPSSSLQFDVELLKVE